MPPRLSDRCKRFLARCFVSAPSGRATARELLSDPWIAAAAVPVGDSDAPAPAAAAGAARARPAVTLRMAELRGAEAAAASRLTATA